jgi:hypothetical protein
MVATGAFGREANLAGRAAKSTIGLEVVRARRRRRNPAGLGFFSLTGLYF